MKYPKYTDYEKMYKRYFDKGVGYLIDKADVKRDDKVLDICGGNGRLTRELLKRCNDVSYLDREIDMIPEDLEKHGVRVYNEDVETFVTHSQEKYNKVFCEQAINYWLLNINIEQFSNIFSPNGLFIFNTFSNIPTKTPMIKQYTIDGINYLEISIWLIIKLSIFKLEKDIHHILLNLIGYLKNNIENFFHNILT